jgi:hypothetical protein
MFHLFQTYVCKHFDLDVVYVSHICCKGMFQMFQSYFATSVFMLQVECLSEIAYVAMTIHVHCKCMFQMFQLFSLICCKCFIWMLHMLQLLYTYIASVCF